MYLITKQYILFATLTCCSGTEQAGLTENSACTLDRMIFLCQGKLSLGTEEQEVMRFPAIVVLLKDLLMDCSHLVLLQRKTRSAYFPPIYVDLSISSGILLRMFMGYLSKGSTWHLRTLQTPLYVQIMHATTTTFLLAFRQNDQETTQLYSSLSKNCRTLLNAKGILQLLYLVLTSTLQILSINSSFNMGFSPKKVFMTVHSGWSQSLPFLSRQR